MYKFAKYKQYKDTMIVARYMSVSLGQLTYIIKVDAVTEDTDKSLKAKVMLCDRCSFAFKL